VVLCQRNACRKGGRSEHRMHVKVLPEIIADQNEVQQLGVLPIVSRDRFSAMQRIKRDGEPVRGRAGIVAIDG